MIRNDVQAVSPPHSGNWILPFPYLIAKDLSRQILTRTKPIPAKPRPFSHFDTSLLFK